MRGDVSSQFLTGLLMVLPLVAHDRDVVVAVEGELISKPYIEITLALLARFGVQVRREGWSRFTIPAGSQYVSPGEVDVEGDASGASYFIATGAIAGTGEGVRIDGVAAPRQGDMVSPMPLQAMGATSRWAPTAGAPGPVAAQGHRVGLRGHPRCRAMTRPAWPVSPKAARCCAASRAGA